MTEGSPTDLLAISEAAEQYKEATTIANIRRACRLGHLPARKIGWQWVFTRADFEAWLADETQHKPGPKAG